MIGSYRGNDSHTHTLTHSQIDYEILAPVMVQSLAKGSIVSSRCFQDITDTTIATQKCPIQFIVTIYLYRCTD